ncbi:hypothetical protein [Methylobacter tundripaludum]|uniref:Circularly permuted ATP-grasp superfamily protein n=1 Tax=Methylobacter tundripaludum (strain ATCC BAA-1195 / DSM 17260 / SV96) TaxID=697282 RepID=G3J1X4_METTV|nr:hypothetical protein [Methylobacter tundripaludum]EGW19730.1 hypothetical protein Mettu_2839 [Methylobacter tundripaludum SV96]
MTPLPQVATEHESTQLIDQRNAECRYLSLDRDAMRKALRQQLDDDLLYRMLIEERPHQFAEALVVVAESNIRSQRDIITAIESVIAMPAYQQRVLAYAPGAAQFIPKAHGVFFGYDFHLSPKGPQLIEINSNAGGALLNAILIRAQTACCDSAGLNASAVQNPEQAFMAMFLEEWQSERGQRPLHSIAIVDENPPTQFMLPEFLLFKKLFEQNNINTVICDPSELDYRDGALWHGDMPIDLVYNRLTDFGLEAGALKPLREAYLAEAVVVTPHPRAHALYADKRNLAILTDETALRELGVAVETRALLLGGIAHTDCVHKEDAEALWAARKHLFFKPAKGYGSKAAYRGDGVTKRVFGEIVLQGNYVAQALVRPTERQLKVENEMVDLKLDLRQYVYRAQAQLTSARLYQGQTTNFRTPGSGFAGVVVISDDGKGDRSVALALT